MAKSYVKFQTPQNLVAKIKDAVSAARQTGRVRKGINEVTKCIEAGRPSLVVLAEDIDPEEIALHIPMICEEKGVYYCYLPTKKEVGEAAGLEVPCSSVCIEQDGQAGEKIRDVKEGLSPLFPKKEEKKVEAPAPAKKEEKKAGGEAPGAKPAGEKKPEAGKEGEKPKKERKPRAPKKKEGEAGAAPKEGAAPAA